MTGLDRWTKIENLVSRETIELLHEFAELAIRWNRSYNLFSASTATDIWARHILDSLQLVEFLGERTRVLDVGSGGGFPGLILAIAFRKLPNSKIFLFESNRKKAAFLASVIGRMALNASVHTSRIEESSSDEIEAEIVTARAVTSLVNTLGLTAPWLCTGAIGLFHKGRDHAAEIEVAQERWAFDVVKYKSMVEDDSVVLEISNLQPVERGQERV